MDEAKRVIPVQKAFIWAVDLWSYQAFTPWNAWAASTVSFFCVSFARKALEWWDRHMKRRVMTINVILGRMQPYESHNWIEIQRPLLACIIVPSPFDQNFFIQKFGFVQTIFSPYLAFRKIHFRDFQYSSEFLFIDCLQPIYWTVILPRCLQSYYSRNHHLAKDDQRNTIFCQEAVR